MCGGMPFDLAPAFVSTSHPVCDLPLCHVRLQGDARFAWLVLIPRVESVREIEELSREDRGRLLDEIVLAGGAVRAVGAALGRPVEKLNVGQLGNVTPQLHVHVVGRRADDPAWPGPVWGVAGGEDYGAGPLDTAIAAAGDWLRREALPVTPRGER
ncbi:HIT domain-containing protein [Phenylobacterium terrae]|uniref:HIT domain-containing protein n=1 Tax=Phenylobacterium terrae TaxID=2665495 RepID=A0ABW4N131_9CAUL